MFAAQHKSSFSLASPSSSIRGPPPPYPQPADGLLEPPIRIAMPSVDPDLTLDKKAMPPSRTHAADDEDLDKLLKRPVKSIT